MDLVIYSEAQKEAMQAVMYDFEKILKDYKNLVFSICYEATKDYFEAEDLTQETFLSVYTHLSSFDGANLQAWVCRIATNKCLDYLKSAARRTAPNDWEAIPEERSKEPAPEDYVEESEVKEWFRTCCNRLKPPYDSIALSFFYYEMTASQIAKEKGEKLKTIQSRVYRAKGMLKKQWRKEYG